MMALTLIQWLAIIGFLLSVYFIYVKDKIKSKKKYKALCDITENISCSKAAKSSYSQIFVIPNAFLGIIFYSFVFIFSLFGFNLYIFILSVLASLLSIYLIFLSFKFKIACPVCISTYIINFLILYISYKNLF